MERALWLRDKGQKKEEEEEDRTDCYCPTPLKVLSEKCTTC